MFTLEAHSTPALPSWIRHEGGYVYVRGNTFALRIPTDVEEARFFTLLAPADGYKQANLDNPASCGVIEVPVKGQKTRIKSLFTAIEVRDFHAVKRIVASLTKYHAKYFSVEIWSYEEDREVPRALRRHGHGHTFARAGKLNEQRRHCYATGIDHVLVKFAGGTEQEISETLDILESEEGGLDHIGGHPIREDAGMCRAFQKVLAHYTERGYVPAGGSPDAGLLLFVRPETVTGVETAESLQRAGKIMLRGGLQLRGGPEDTIAAELVDFESGEYGHRDGIFMVVYGHVIAPIARKSGVEAAWSYQGHYIEEGVSFMKGMVYVVGRNCPTRHLRKLLGSSEMPAVVDINIYNKVVDTGAQVGDIVQIDPKNLWVMEADVSNAPKTVRLSAQLLERAGELLAQWLDDKMTRGIASFVHDVSTGVYGDHISPFTRIGKLINLGLPAFEADKEKIEEELAKTAALYARKGVRVKGADARLFHDDDLSVDVTSDGQQIPGARVPKQWGLNVGDRFVFVAYPALPGLDDQDRNTCIFVCEVEEVHDSPHIYLHGDVAAAALRDEDGDRPIVLLPRERDDELPAVGQAKLKLTTRLSGADAIKAEASAAEKQQVFGANVSDRHDLLTRAKRLFQVYMRLGSQVGTVDNCVSSIMLYLGDRIHSVDTPTGEHATVFMSKFIQATIEAMKHVVDGRYTLHKLNAWTKEILPEASVEEDGQEKFVHHPALEVRKPANGETTIMQHLKALEGTRSALNSRRVHSSGLWAEKVNHLFTTLPRRTIEVDNGDDFVVPIVDKSLLMTDRRFHIACDVLCEAVSSIFEDSEVFNACSILTEKFYRDSLSAGRAAAISADEDKGLAFWKAQTDALLLAGTKLRFELLPAERLAVDTLRLCTAPKSATGAKLARVALHAGSREIIQMLGRVITEELTAADVKAELGLDGRDHITSSISNKLDQYVRHSKHTASEAGIRVELDDTDGIAEGDVVTAGAPGIKQVRLITLAGGERRWIDDKSIGEIKVLSTTKYTVVGVDHDTGIVELS